MSTKTYSEQRQAVFFQAACRMFRIAAQVLNDVQQDAEYRNVATIEWVKNQARVAMDAGRALENQGHEIRIASGHQEAALRRAKDEHSKAIDALLERMKASRAAA